MLLVPPISSPRTSPLIIAATANHVMYATFWQAIRLLAAAVTELKLESIPIPTLFSLARDMTIYLLSFPNSAPDEQHTALRVIEALSLRIAHYAHVGALADYDPKHIREFAVELGGLAELRELVKVHPQMLFAVECAVSTSELLSKGRAGYHPTPELLCMARIHAAEEIMYSQNPKSPVSELNGVKASSRLEDALEELGTGFMISGVLSLRIFELPAGRNLKLLRRLMTAVRALTENGKWPWQLLHCYCGLLSRVAIDGSTAKIRDTALGGSTYWALFDLAVFERDPSSRRTEASEVVTDEPIDDAWQIRVSALQGVITARRCFTGPHNEGLRNTAAQAELACRAEETDPRVLAVLGDEDVGTLVERLGRGIAAHPFSASRAYGGAWSNVLRAVTPYAPEESPPRKQRPPGRKTQSKKINSVETDTSSTPKRALAAPVTRLRPPTKPNVVAQASADLQALVLGQVASERSAFLASLSQREEERLATIEKAKGQAVLSPTHPVYNVKTKKLQDDVEKLGRYTRALQRQAKQDQHAVHALVSGTVRDELKSTAPNFDELFNCEKSTVQ